MHKLVIAKEESGDLNITFTITEQDKIIIQPQCHLYEGYAGIFDFSLVDNIPHGRGYGSSAYQLLEKNLKDKGYSFIVAEHVTEKMAENFWVKMGFKKMASDEVFSLVPKSEWNSSLGGSFFIKCFKN